MNYMDMAIKEAIKAYNKNEVPVGAIIIKDNKVIGKGHNNKETLNDATMHAEIIAIREASKNINNWRLNGCEMYVTLEPCMMCASAILQSRISKIHIGTFDENMGGFGSLIDMAYFDKINNNLKVFWEYDKRCSNILVDFFKNKR